MTKIIADSTCDLSKELIEKYDIEILPLHIIYQQARPEKDKPFLTDTKGLRAEDAEMHNEMDIVTALTKRDIQ